MIEPLVPLDGLNRARAQANQIIRTAGKLVTWRQFNGITPGNPEFGIGDSLNYNEKSMMVLIQLPTEPQMQLEGGQLIRGQITVSVQEKFTSQDEMIWDGVRYRVDSEVPPVILGGVVLYRCQMSRAGV